MSDPRQLNRIVIKGFKSIREAEIELRDLNVFIGANGAGKSNFVSLFKLLREIIERRLQVYTGERGANYFLYGGSKTTNTLHISLRFGIGLHDNIYRINLKPTFSDTLGFSSEVVGYQQTKHYNSPKTHTLGRGHKETLLKTPYFNRQKIITGYVISTLQKWRVYHFHDTSETSNIKKVGNIDDNRQFREDGSNLAAFLYRIQQISPDSYQKIVRTV